MKAKFTKGKWYIQSMGENSLESDFWVKSDTNNVVHYGTDIMCEDYGDHNGYPREQRMADAKLIVQAPNMYQFLTEYIETMNNKGKLTNHETAMKNSAEKIIKEI